ncbi:MAG TPA: response regulator [Clostridia bacterium]|nr:response regulator [Clostridia bacterium]
MSAPGQEFIEIFLQEASEHLQFLREYSGILQDPYPAPDDVERLFISAHGLAGTSGTYGFRLFSEVSGKLAHIFQYAMNATISPEASGPLVEFISETIAVLETDLLMISATSAEAEEDITAFKQKYPFAFQAAATPSPAPVAEPEPEPLAEATEVASAPAYSDEAPLGPEFGPEMEPVSVPAPVAKAKVSTPVAAAVVDVPDLPLDGEVPTEVMEFFIPEVEEHLQAVTECLLALEANPNPEDINRLFRAMHTIKGSAAQVGLHRIATVAHHAEDLIGRLRDGELRPSARIVDLCLESGDTLKKLLYSQWADEAGFQRTVKSLMARIANLAPEEKQEGDSAAAENAPAEVKAGGEATPVLLPTPDAAARDAAKEKEKEDSDVLVTKREPTGMPQSKSVRIGLERLDRMMNAVGELVINRTRMLGRLAELERLAEVLTFSKARMSDKVAEFQDKYEFARLTTTPSYQPGGQHQVPRPSPIRDDGSWGSDGNFPFRTGYSSYSHTYDASLAEFSELEMDRYDDFGILSRSLTEISADISEVLTQLDGFVRRVDSDIDEFTKLAHRLQDEITQARMVPIGNLYTRISRTVRDSAKAANKHVELTLAGAETELDNNIIQQIADPLLHLVRNAVAHGIERTEDRYNAGKPDVGNVAVRAYHRGNHIYIEVEDDGRGIDYERVRGAAVDAGLFSADDAAGLSERDLLDLLFHPGFSTAPRKTELSGRGVGLDVVRANLNALNGEIEIETQKGLGSRFTLKVPLTLIISQALFVRCGAQTYAFPLAFVEEIRRIRNSDIEDVGGKLLTKVRDVVTEVVRLDGQLGLDDVEPVNGWYRLVIVNVAGRQVGIVVEEVLRKDEIVIKSLGEFLRNVKLFPGATIAPDGSLILLVDINRLIVGESIERRPLMTAANAARVFAPGAVAVAAGEIPVEAIDVVEREKVVVLADDSISVRKFVGRMLEKAGYRVRLASDGLEALEIASQNRCDLVVTDLEMPRTNGYELMLHLRQNAATAHLPVMVVTSRAGAKHRERAMKEGAASFMVKPVQEDQFIAEVAKMIGTSGQARPAGAVVGQ